MSAGICCPSGDTENELHRVDIVADTALTPHAGAETRPEMKGSLRSLWVFLLGGRFAVFLTSDHGNIETVGTCWTSPLIGTGRSSRSTRSWSATTRYPDCALAPRVGRPSCREPSTLIFWGSMGPRSKRKRGAVKESANEESSSSEASRHRPDHGARPFGFAFTSMLSFRLSAMRRATGARNAPSPHTGSSTRAEPQSDRPSSRSMLTNDFWTTEPVACTTCAIRSR